MEPFLLMLTVCLVPYFPCWDIFADRRKTTLNGPWRILKMHEISVICQCHDYLGSIAVQKYPKLLIVSKK